MVRTYLLYRDWSGYPDWFNAALLDDIEDGNLGSVVELIAEKALAAMTESDRDRFYSPDGPHRLRTFLESGDGGYLPSWSLFSDVDSETTAPAIIHGLKLRVTQQATFKWVPRTAISRAEGLVFERKLEDLDKQIRDTPLVFVHVAKPHLGMKKREPSLREKLRIEALELARVAESAPQEDFEVPVHQAIPKPTVSETKVAQRRTVTRAEIVRPASVSLAFWTPLDDTERSILCALVHAKESGDGCPIKSLRTLAKLETESSVTRALKRLSERGAVITRTARGFLLDSTPDLPLARVKAAKSPKKSGRAKSRPKRA